METASCLLICGNAALYLALICRLPAFEGAFPAMLLVLGLGLLMLLLAARFRYLPALRIALAPLPFLSLLLLPPGPGWISFLPVPLIMALFAVLDRFDWDNWQTGRWMRPVLALGALLPKARRRRRASPCAPCSSSSVSWVCACSGWAIWKAARPCW